MNALEIYKEKIFENIKHIDEFGNEYWEARELQKVLEYTEWRKFNGVIGKAKEACMYSNYNINEHFVGSDKMVKTGDSIRKIGDYKLSRYACYLIVQNSDSRKKVVALGQTYFAVQTRKQELLEDEIKQLSEEEKRIKIRSQVKEGNKNLNSTVYKVGARTNKEFAEFHNEGYKGLYGGESVSDIRIRKGILKNEEVLDYMGSTELAANWFRITQADEMIKREEINTLNEANKTHNKAGKEVRKTMKRLSGIYPEDLPTPEKSIRKIEPEELSKIERK